MNAAWPSLLALAVLFCPDAAKGDEKKSSGAATAAQAAERPAQKVADLQRVIDEVHRAEQRYQNLETVVRISWQDEPRPNADPQSQLNLSKEEDTQHLIRQGELFSFDRRKVQTFVSGEPVVTQQFAAFDGQTTRSIVYGNCVNLFDGRHEPSQVYPPHVWGMYPLRVNFPLSVYLQGIDAIRRHPKSFKSPQQRGRTFEIAKLEILREADEVVDGLDCVKLRCRRWSREGDVPLTAEIWLARDRNYLCAKSASSFGQGEQARPSNQAQVKEWIELGSGLWLPKRVEMTFFRSRRPGGAAEIWRRQTLLAVKTSVNPNYPVSHFQKSEFPHGLPVYKINREGFLEGAAVKSARSPAADARELAHIIDELKRQERLYERLDVSLVTTYRTFEAQNIGIPGLYLSSHETERAVALPGKIYAERRQQAHTVSMGDPLWLEKAGWDGQWSRSLHWRADEKGELPAEPSSAQLRKGGPKGVDAFRPHTALFSDHRMRSRPLSDFLTAEYWDEVNKYRYRVDYLGEETLGDLACFKLRLGFMAEEQTAPSNGFYFLWLAKDRNYLPVRAEHCDLSRSDRLPTGLTYVDDLRELTPRLWFPFHVVELAHDTLGPDGIGSGQLAVTWRRDRQVEQAKLEPQVPDDLFAPSVPAGTTVYVSGKAGRNVGHFRQAEDGPPQVDDQKLRLMEETARVNQEERKRRQAAMDALVGAALPEFPDAKWLNSSPLTGESLRGKVLLIDFWAEWCGPCRSDLQRLGNIDRELAKDGVTVIGVHTAGSQLKEIEALAKELGLDYPIYVDLPNPDGKVRWGKVFERFAVRELPHAFVVDQHGKIVAHGRLDQMIQQAGALADKKQP